MTPSRLRGHPEDELTALVDGALPPARAAALEAHLQGCAACRAARDRLAATAAAFARLPPAPEPSPRFAARLAARLAREGPPPRSRWARLGAWADPSALRWKLAAPAAAAALAASVVVVAVRAQRAEEEAIAANLDLLLEYEAVASLDAVSSAEDAAVVAVLDELEPARGTP